ncbi:hypothetical protein IEQ34_018916 [Dendrobium chrysotoxum]|uniref:Ternary complex factor MIP1 leucine-zipper domain-containing protein n=1 Tax=Dendrobium chrysotoxum TaxID=161865 RepID=A0AAV7G5W1_DENCH|nr:hypothetical protein IEQ34_018916 [Dendrobium chrysotoxum]
MVGVQTHLASKIRKAVIKRSPGAGRGGGEEMNSGVWTAEQTMKAAPKHDKRTMGSSISISSHADNESNSYQKASEKMEERKSEVSDRCELKDSYHGPKRRMWRRERKLALLQDVDKLRKKLKHEENVHRALERAFTRPLGALPRLPPFLPSQTLELLAEVAVLEEEVVKLEAHVLNFRQGLYQEAIYISSTKINMENGVDMCHVGFPSQNAKNSEQYKAPFLLTDSNPSISGNSPSMRWSSDGYLNLSSSSRFTNGKQIPKKLNSSFAEDHRGKENQSSINTAKNVKQSFVKKASGSRILDSQPECHEPDKERHAPRIQGSSNEKACEEISDANKLSEEILRCLLSIFAQINMPKNIPAQNEMCRSVSDTSGTSKDVDFQDPYGICTEFGWRDIGPYKHLHVVDSTSIDTNLISEFAILSQKLKLLLGKLASVFISELTQQQKLAFWINVYNSCMMNAFLENGIPTTSEMVIALMPKAIVNVGGHLFSAMIIEHFILRLPYYWKHTSPKRLKGEEMTRWSMFGLDWPEPLVTFALSCGSWSSPAVRVYTASQIEQQLEDSKRDYLQAAIGVSMPSRLAIPKLLDWYLLDFAKDMESLMDWICLQLPTELRNDAVQCLEMSRRSAIPQPIQVLPYEFKFRYLLEP